LWKTFIALRRAINIFYRQIISTVRLGREWALYESAAMPLPALTCQVGLPGYGFNGNDSCNPMAAEPLTALLAFPLAFVGPLA